MTLLMYSADVIRIIQLLRPENHNTCKQRPVRLLRRFGSRYSEVRYNICDNLNSVVIVIRIQVKQHFGLKNKTGKGITKAIHLALMPLFTVLDAFSPSKICCYDKWNVQCYMTGPAKIRCFVKFTALRLQTVNWSYHAGGWSLSAHTCQWFTRALTVTH